MDLIKYLFLCFITAIFLFCNAQKEKVVEIQMGKASWYHPSLSGNKTSSGDPYSPMKLTAAHRSLPFGSRVRVTNLLNNRRVIVIINDRGPYVEGRIIDLSGSAADSLRMRKKGIVPVRLEVLE